MNIIATFIGAIFEIYIGHMFFSKFGERKVSTKIYITLMLAITSLLIVTSIALAKSGLMFIASSFCFFIFSSLFKIKPTKKIILTCAFLITAALSEMIIAMATTLGIDVSLNTIQNNDIVYSVCILASKFLTFAILKPIKKSPFDSANKFPIWFKIGTSVLPFTSVFIIILLYRYTYIVNDTTSQVCTLIAAILLIIANLLILFVIDKQELHLKTTERLLFAEAHIKNQLSHYSELYAQQEALKKFQHDSKNFYTSLISILETLSIQDAINYVKDKIEIDIFNNNTINSGHPVIDATIYSKSLYAQKQGVSIDCNLKITTNILIDELELGVLIGNALDNAIEAASELDESKSKVISLNILSSGDMLSIEVSNQTNTNIDTLNLTTTKKDARMHGYGLNSIETITKKYKGNLYISCENNIFTLSAILVNI